MTERNEFYRWVLEEVVASYGKELFFTAEKAGVTIDRFKETMKNRLDKFKDDEIKGGLEWMIENDNSKFPDLQSLINNIVTYKQRKREVCIGGNFDDDPDYDPYYDDPTMERKEYPPVADDYDFFESVLKKVRGVIDGE